MKFFIMLLVLAALWDYCRRRIPNGLLAVLFLCGIAEKVRQGGYVGAIGYAGMAACVGIILYPLFKLGTIGAGDVKLFACVSGVLTVREAIWFVFISFSVAAVLALGKMLLFGDLVKRIRVFQEYAEAALLTGSVPRYPGGKGKQDSICLAGPILLGFLCCKGGIY